MGVDEKSCKGYDGKKWNGWMTGSSENTECNEWW